MEKVLYPVSFLLMKEKGFVSFIMVVSLAAVAFLGYQLFFSGQCLLWGQSWWCRTEWGVFVALFLLMLLRRRSL